MLLTLQVYMNEKKENVLLKFVGFFFNIQILECLNCSVQCV